MTPEGQRQGTRCLHRYYHVVVPPIPLAHEETTAQARRRLPEGALPLQTLGSEGQQGSLALRSALRRNWVLFKHFRLCLKKIRGNLKIKGSFWLTSWSGRPKHQRTASPSTPLRGDVHSAGRESPGLPSRESLLLREARGPGASRAPREEGRGDSILNVKT